MVRRFLAGFLCAAVLMPAAQLTLTPLDEAAYQKTVASHKGSVLLVNFWATWCSSCLEEMPHLVKLEAKYRAKGFRLVTISADEKEEEADARAFLQKQGVRAPVYIKRANNDTRFIDAIDAKWSGALPALFLYDRNGKKVESFIGETEVSTIEGAIRKHL